MRIKINDEFSKLKTVIVASAETYYDHDAINNNQLLYYQESPPSKKLLIEQQKRFFEILDVNGVELLFSTPLMDCPDQLNTRDPSFCIGNTFFISAMKESLRKREKDGLMEIVKSIDSQVVRLDDCTIEGGDIIVHGDTVFVGISRRTNMNGLKVLKTYIDSTISVVPIVLKEGFLHLDTVFNTIDNKLALCCPDAISEESLGILRQEFYLINVTLEEQLHLGTNVLSLAPHKVVSQIYTSRINDELRLRKIEVITIDYSEGAKLGGAFRCATCPLIRDNY